MKNIKRIFAITSFLLITALILSVFAACGDESQPEEQIENENEDEEAKAEEEPIIAESDSVLIVEGIEFTLHELSLTPMFAPADMPEGNKPFMVRLSFIPDDNSGTITDALYKEGYFMVDGEKVVSGASTIMEGTDSSIYSLISSCEQITGDSSIKLIYKESVLIIQ